MTAEYDANTGHYTLYAGSGRGAAKLRLDVATYLAQIIAMSGEFLRLAAER